MDCELAQAPADLFITEALASRPDRERDYKSEANAIQRLAIRMADEPEAVLPEFVELAMKLTEAASAGLSLYEPEPAPGVFRWHFLKGTLSRFEGATTTPRDSSPCGVTLDRNAPTLLRHPGRFYRWIAEAEIEAPEVLLVPLFGGGEPLGALWVVAPEEGHFDADHARLLAELAECVGLAVTARAKPVAA